MKTIAGFAAGLLVASAALVVAQDAPAEASKSSAGRQKWEYSTGRATKDELRNRGENGWELVAVVGVPNHEPSYSVTYFKRPKVDD